MRGVVLCMGVCLGLGTAADAFAQSPAPLVRVETPSKRATATTPTGPRRRAMTDAEQQIYDRAVARAREREFRLETKKWAGYVPSRPAVLSGNRNTPGDWYTYYQNPYFSHQPFSFYRGF